MPGSYYLHHPFVSACSQGGPNLKVERNGVNSMLTKRESFFQIILFKRCLEVMSANKKDQKKITE